MRSTRSPATSGHSAIASVQYSTACSGASNRAARISAGAKCRRDASSAFARASRTARTDSSSGVIVNPSKRQTGGVPIADTSMVAPGGIARFGFTSVDANNELRFGGGLETFGYRGLHGWFEVAYAFNRQILYRSGTPSYYPSDTVMLRAGIAY